MSVAAQSVETGDDERRAERAGRRQRSRELRALVVRTAFRLDKLLDQRPASAVEPGPHRLALCLQTKAGLALPRGRDAQIRNGRCKN